MLPKWKIIGTNDDLWNRVHGVGNEIWKGCE